MRLSRVGFLVGALLLSSIGGRDEFFRPVTAGATAAGFLDASPNPVFACSELGRTTISWDTGNDFMGEVWGDMDYGTQVLFARTPAGTQEAPWIQRNHVYHFTLYEGLDRSRVRFEHNVFRQGASVGGNPAGAPAGSGLGTTTISWNTGDCSEGEVWVDDLMDSPGEALFARSPSGTQEAPWIQSKHKYLFRLYRGTDKAAVLGESSVLRGPDLTVSGHVRLNDSSGPGVANVMVGVYLAGYQSPSGTALTPADGSYEVSVDLQGHTEAVEVRPSLAGYTFTPVSSFWQHPAGTIGQRTVNFVANPG